MIFFFAYIPRSSSFYICLDFIFFVKSLHIFVSIIMLTPVEKNALPKESKIKLSTKDRNLGTTSLMII